MTELAILLPLAAFVALAALSAIVLRRAGGIVARTREVEGFRRSVRDLAARVDTSLEGATGRIDAVRRGQAAADTVSATIEAATDAVERYAGEARAFRGPPHVQAIRDDLVADLERATRALQTIEHGATILSRVRRGDRELEAQTALKRGYLNLIHAREAIARHAQQVDDLQVSVDPGGRNAVISVREPRS